MLSSTTQHTMSQKICMGIQQILKINTYAFRSGHSPVTDVSWSPNGDLLVSCCGADTSMLIWDVSMETAIPLRRVAGGGIVFARWSLTASKIFAATSSIIFRFANYVYTQIIITQCCLKL